MRLVGSLHGAILVDRLLLRVVARQHDQFDVNRSGSGLELLKLAIFSRGGAITTVEAPDVAPVLVHD